MPPIGPVFPPVTIALLIFKVPPPSTLNEVLSVVPYPVNDVIVFPSPTIVRVTPSVIVICPVIFTFPVRFHVVFAEMVCGPILSFMSAKEVLFLR